MSFPWRIVRKSDDTSTTLQILKFWRLKSCKSIRLRRDRRFSALLSRCSSSNFGQESNRVTSKIWCSSLGMNEYIRLTDRQSRKECTNNCNELLRQTGSVSYARRGESCSSAESYISSIQSCQGLPAHLRQEKKKSSWGCRWNLNAANQWIELSWKNEPCVPHTHIDMWSCVGTDDTWCSKL